MTSALVEQAACRCSAMASDWSNSWDFCRAVQIHWPAIVWTVALNTACSAVDDNPVIDRADAWEKARRGGGR